MMVLIDDNDDAAAGDGIDAGFGFGTCDRSTISRLNDECLLKGLNITQRLLL